MDDTAPKDERLRQLTTMLDARQEKRHRALHLLVIGPDAFASHPLQAPCSLVIGRGETADIPLSDPMSSRLHARLHVSELGTVEIEDLGSINRTRVRDVVLSPGERVAIQPGEGVTIGSTVVMIQETRTIARLRRVWPHTYFEARLEEECNRAQELKMPFCALRLHVDGGVAPGLLADLLSSALRPTDMLALYGPHEYELLLPNTTREFAQAIADDLVARLGEQQTTARVGLACFPADGRSPEMLLSVACQRVLEKPHQDSGAPAGVVVEDGKMRRLMELAARIAKSPINVLVVGETGAGKEIVAEALHRFSNRASAPLVSVNCAAFAENLLESELFGHEKGAFTGAARSKPGLLETAPGGTIFLDEIGELPLGLQAKLLRVIETRRITRVGSLEERPLDVRFVAATNRSLETEVAAGRFRRDLYFRLNGVTLQVPPLRERPADVLPLARAFVARFAVQMERAAPSFAPETVLLLERYCWPGNVRELRNVMERAVVLCPGSCIYPEHLPVETMATNSLLTEVPAAKEALPSPAAVPREAAPPFTSPASHGGEDERERILRALADCAGNQTRAARMLGIARSTLVTKLEAYNLPRPRK